MKFGPATPSACEGAILAHAVYLPDGRLRKGSRLSVADIVRLETAGVETVTVAFLEPSELVAPLVIAAASCCCSE